jgi:serine/threonine-protein kinase
LVAAAILAILRAEAAPDMLERHHWDAAESGNQLSGTKLGGFDDSIPQDRSSKPSLVLAPVAAGERLSEQLELVESLAPDGRLWLGEHNKVGPVLVTIVAEVPRHERSQFAKGFNRRASAAYELDHPNIASIVSHGVTRDGIAFVATEPLEGALLSERLERRGELSVDAIERIVRAAGEALDHAHERNVIHGDLKPSSIAVAEAADGWRVKVRGFGVAQPTRLPSLEGIPSARLTLSTPELMSPELCEGHAPDAAADHWALAVIAYIGLTYQLPFEARTVGQLFERIRRAEVTAPSSLRRDVPKDLDGWFARALCHDPSERFASGREMARRFGEPVEPPPPRERRSKRKSRSDRPEPPQVQVIAPQPGPQRSEWGGPALAIGLLGALVGAIVGAVAIGAMRSERSPAALPPIVHTVEVPAAAPPTAPPSPVARASAEPETTSVAASAAPPKPAARASKPSKAPATELRAPSFATAEAEPAPTAKSAPEPKPALKTPFE